MPKMKTELGHCRSGTYYPMQYSAKTNLEIFKDE